MIRVPCFGMTDPDLDAKTRQAYRLLCEATGQEPDWEDDPSTYVIPAADGP
jgi:hypothetical protein